MVTKQPVHVSAVRIAPHYADLADHIIAAALSGEDTAEVSFPTQFIAVSGHRWVMRAHCQHSRPRTDRGRPADLPRRGTAPNGPAAQQIVRCCRASVAAATAYRWTSTLARVR